MIDLKTFRKANNLRQKDIADYLGVGIAFVSAFETGRSKMPDYISERLQKNDRGWVTDGIGDNAIAKVAKVDDGGMLAAIVAKIDAQNARFEEQNRQIDRLLTIVEQLTQQKK